MRKGISICTNMIDVDMFFFSKEEIEWLQDIFIATTLLHLLNRFPWNCCCVLGLVELQVGGEIRIGLLMKGIGEQGRRAGWADGRVNWEGRDSTSVFITWCIWVVRPRNSVTIYFQLSLQWASREARIVMGNISRAYFMVSQCTYFSLLYELR